MRFKDVTSSGQLVALALASGLAAFGISSQAFADEQFSIQSTIAVPATAVNPSGKLTSWDISYVDPFVHAYFLADRNNRDVDVVDLNTKPFAVTKQFSDATHPFQGIVADPNVAGPNDVSGPNGVVIVNHAEAWATDAPSFSGPIVKSATPSVAYAADNCDSSVKVFDLLTGKLTDFINTGGCFRSDELAFDPVDQLVLVANPAETNIGKSGAPTLPFLTLISSRPGNHKIVKKISLKNAIGGIEQPAYSKETGLFYIAMPQVDANPLHGGYLVIDPRGDRDGDADDIRVLATFPINNCVPQGNALGPDFEAYLGCNATKGSPTGATGRTLVIDIRDGRTIKSFSQGAGGCDETWFNPGDDHFLGACLDTNGNHAINIVDADESGFGPQFDGTVGTGSAAITGNPHSVAADPVTNLIFVPLPATDDAVGASACTALGCIAVIGTPGADDPSVWVQEREEGHHWWVP